MLHREELVLHLIRHLVRLGQGAVHITGDIHLARVPARAADLGQALNLRLDGGLETGRIGADAGDQLRDQAAFLIQQCIQKVCLFNLRVAVFQRQGLGRLNGLLRFLCKVFLVHSSTSQSEDGDFSWQLPAVKGERGDGWRAVPLSGHWISILRVWGTWVSCLGRVSCSTPF